MAKKVVSLGSIISKMNGEKAPTAPTKAAVPVSVAAPTPKEPTKTDNAAVGERIVELDLELILLNPDQPRKSFNSESLEELAKSVLRCGIIQPLIVTAKDGKYLLVAGERRLRAAKIAGLTKVPVIIKNSAETQQREIALIENIQRENLNPVEEAKAMQQLMQLENLTVEELAVRLGKSRPAVSNAIRLLSLPELIMQYVVEGKLTAGHAKVLLGVKRRETMIALAKECIAKDWSVRTLEERCAEKAPVPKKTAKLSTELSAFETDMQRIFATDVTLTGNLNKGKIVIQYSSDGELKRIYDLIEELKDSIDC